MTKKTTLWYTFIGAKVPKILVKAMDSTRKKKMSRSAFIRESIKEKILNTNPSAIDIDLYNQQLTQGGIE